MKVIQEKNKFVLALDLSNKTQSLLYLKFFQNQFINEFVIWEKNCGENAWGIILYRYIY